MYEFNDHDNRNQGNDWDEPYTDPASQAAGNSSRKKKRDKKKGNKPWMRVVAMALTFGVIAGGTAFATNYAASTIYSSTSADSSDSSSSNTATLTSATTKTSSSTDSTGSDSSTGTVESVAASAMPSMVTISTMSVQEMQSYFGGSQEYEVEGAASGVIIGENDDEYLIATNYHVVEGATQLSVGFIDESVAEANVKGTDSENDLAVIAVNKDDVSDDTKSQISIIEIGDSDSLQLGEQVVAIGNALGYGQSVTSGYVSALDREVETDEGTYTGLIQTDAAINPGNSGGALLNMNGELVGINEAKSSSTSDGTTVDNMGFAIPMSKAEPILEELMNEETKEVVDEEDRGYLGVTVTDVTSEYAEYYNMPEGICITSVESGSAADEAGLQKGDVITSFNGTSVSTTTELENQMQYCAAGDTVEVVVQRSENGEYTEKTVQVTLQSSSSSANSGSSSGQGSGSSGSSAFVG